MSDLDLLRSIVTRYLDFPKPVRSPYNLLRAVGSEVSNRSTGHRFPRHIPHFPRSCRVRDTDHPLCLSHHLAYNTQVSPQEGGCRRWLGRERVPHWTAYRSTFGRCLRTSEEKGKASGTMQASLVREGIWHRPLIVFLHMPLLIGSL